MDHNQERRRGHFHRSRRGPDRRGTERRTQPQEQSNRDHVDVEQIMRDIRSRISQRHGIDLSTQQIQELAARRLEAILDPRAVKPALLDQLRKSAGAPAEPPVAAASDVSFAYSEGAVFESHRGIVRLLRKLFKPLLMLFFNPAPLERALTAQAQLNAEAAKRDAERQREQTGWNALHYELLQRLVTEVSRASIDLQAMSTRVEALAAKVDFNERRVRHIEGTQHQARPAGRPLPVETREPAAAMTQAGPLPEAATSAEPATESAPAGEGSRRRRRRRRGRRGGGVPGEQPSQNAGAIAANAAGDPAAADLDDDEGDEGEDVQPQEAAPEPEPERALEAVAAEPPSAAAAAALAPAPEPEPFVTPPPPPETDRTE